MNTQRFMVPVLAGALVASGVGAALAQVVAQELRGQVKSVDPDTNRLIVTQTGTGADVPVTVNPQTQIVTTTNTGLTLTDLARGDGVVVTHAGGIALRILVSPAPLAGIVQSIDPDARRLVVRLSETDTERTFMLGDRVAITTDEDEALGVGDLKEGDRVLITREGDLARRIVVLAKLAELVGHVKSIAPDYSSFVLTEMETKTDVTVGVDEDTVIETTEGKRLDIKELKEGDGVGLTHVGSVAKRILVNVRVPER